MHGLAYRLAHHLVCRSLYQRHVWQRAAPAQPDSEQHEYDDDRQFVVRLVPKSYFSGSAFHVYNLIRRQKQRDRSRKVGRWVKRDVDGQWCGRASARDCESKQLFIPQIHTANASDAAADKSCVLL